MPGNQPRPPLSDRPPPLVKQEAPTVRRLGRFAINQALLQGGGNHITALAIYRDMVVLRVEANFVTEKLHVWAESTLFDVTVQGEEIPEYSAVITAPKNLPPKTHHDLAVKWTRTKPKPADPPRTVEDGLDVS
jgi:hypothetical protein